MRKGHWVAFTPWARVVPHQTGDARAAAGTADLLQEIASGGLYSADLVRKLQTSTQFPNQQDAVMSVITRRVMGQNVDMTGYQTREPWCLSEPVCCFEKVCMLFPLIWFAVFWFSHCCFVVDLCFVLFYLILFCCDLFHLVLLVQWNFETEVIEKFCKDGAKQIHKGKESSLADHVHTFMFDPDIKVLSSRVRASQKPKIVYTCMVSYWDSWVLFTCTLHISLSKSKLQVFESSRDLLVCAGMFWQERNLNSNMHLPSWDKREVPPYCSPVPTCSRKIKPSLHVESASPHWQRKLRAPHWRGCD